MDEGWCGANLDAEEPYSSAGISRRLFVGDLVAYPGKEDRYSQERL